MKLLKSYKNFKTYTQDMENVGTLLISETENGEIWHEVANTVGKKENIIFIQTKKNDVIAYSEDPTTLVGIEGTDIYMCENNGEVLNGKKYIKIFENNLEIKNKPACKLEGANIKFDYNKEIYFDDSSNEEKLKYWESELIKIQKVIIERRGLGLYPSNENLERKNFCLQKHNEISQEIAFEIEKTSRSH